jgi:hypothetical protein
MHNFDETDRVFSPHLFGNGVEDLQDSFGHILRGSKIFSYFYLFLRYPFI